MINMRISQRRNEVKNLIKCEKVEFKNIEVYRSYDENVKKIYQEKLNDEITKCKE